MSSHPDYDAQGWGFMADNQHVFLTRLYIFECFINLEVFVKKQFDKNTTNKKTHHHVHIHIIYLHVKITLIGMDKTLIPYYSHWNV
jgi:hypothetical protein